MNVHDGLVVLDRRERVVEVVQQRPPPLVRVRLPEALGVVLEPVPAHEEHVAIRLLDASLELQTIETGHRRDDRLRLGERDLEVGRLVGPYVEDRQLEDDRRTVTGAEAARYAALVWGGARNDQVPSGFSTTS